MPSNMDTENRVRAVLEADTNTAGLLGMLKVKLVLALLPVARSFLGKLAVRYATIGGTAAVAWVHESGFDEAIPDAAKFLGALVILAGFATDLLISMASYYLHLTPKAEPVDP